MSRSHRAGFAAIAACALLLSACSDDGATNEPGTEPAAEATTTSSTPEKPGIGDRVEVEGLAVTIDEVTKADEIDWFEYSEEHPGGVRKARDDGKFILVHTTVENTWDRDLMPSCYDADVTLLGDNDADYGPITENGLYPDNSGCNEQLGAGFDEKATYIFEVPEKVEPTGFEFSLAVGLVDSPERGEIAIDEVKEESDSDRPKPTSGTSAPASANRTTSQPTTPAPAQAATSPVLGASCAASQANQPGTAADGTPLVCVNMGASGFSWVSGPSPQGVGTASDGGSCVDGESGGQDDQGRMMMCINGQWVYGP